MIDFSVTAQEPLPNVASQLELKANSNKGVGSPTLIHDGQRWVMFTGGPGINIWHSDQGIRWRHVGTAASPEQLPSWAESEWRESMGTRPNCWAPDISFFNGQYHLYYCISTLGSSHSAIGCLRSPSLDPNDPKYRWVDLGQAVIKTEHRKAVDFPDHYNAIDPNVVIDQQGRPWLVFGSYWSGIKLISIDSSTGLSAATTSSEKATLIDLARRTVERNGSRAVEAPFLVFHDPQQDGGWYYLFVSFGKQQTEYNIRVGRSRKIEGPYLDFSGTPMMEGGGTSVVSSYGEMLAPGHCGIAVSPTGEHWMVHHYRDLDIKDGDGEPTRQLMIRKLVWCSAGWPAAGPPFKQSGKSKPDKETPGSNKPGVEAVKQSLTDSPWRMILDNNPELSFDFQFEDNGGLKFIPTKSLKTDSKSTQTVPAYHIGSWKISQLTPSAPKAETNKEGRNRKGNAEVWQIEIKLSKSRPESGHVFEGQSFCLCLNSGESWFAGRTTDGRPILGLAVLIEN